MEFELKSKVKLDENNTELLDKLLSRCRNSMGMITSMANNLSDKQYHELCHQCYLFHVGDEFSLSVMHGDASFPVDDAEVHDWSITDFETDGHTSARSIANWKRHLLVAKLLSSPTNWAIYCSTMDALAHSID